MPSILDIYHQVCSSKPPLIPPSRQKDLLTALKYLAASYDTTPTQLPLTLALETDYRVQLTTYFQQHPKGYSTIRNTKQVLGQLWKAYHQLEPRTPRPTTRPTDSPVPTHNIARQHMSTRSPYRHIGALKHLPFRLPEDQWPPEIAERWEAYRLTRKHQVRAVTMEMYSREFQSYLSYHLLTPEQRLATLPEPAQRKLHNRTFHDDLQEITADPVLTSWDELFILRRLHSFITWHSWRVHPWDNPETAERRPSRPSTLGQKVILVIEQLAKQTHRQEHTEINRLFRQLPAPKRIHNKHAPIHQFELAELEHVAQALMQEARTMQPNTQTKQRGGRAAARFATGLILALAWRNPLRGRNWCEAILGVHLKCVGEQWRWVLEGDDLKMGKRGSDINRFEPDIPPDIAPAFEEYLADYRPYLPNSANDQHVFLSGRGHPLTHQTLRMKLKVHVYRYTGKYLYTHLLRSLFSTHHLTHGMDINSVAYGLNDKPATVLLAYNQLIAETHRPIIHDANTRALANGNGHVLTPPIIPVTPKPPKPLKTDPDQMALI